MNFCKSCSEGTGERVFLLEFLQQGFVWTLRVNWIYEFVKLSSQIEVNVSKLLEELIFSSHPPHQLW